MQTSIKSYIEYLRQTHGFKISLHGKGVLAHLDFLAPYNVHECMYCMYVKSSEECWHRCRKGQSAAEEKARAEGAYFGSCYAGVGEFVFPLYAFDMQVGFISVGGYVGSAEKRSRFALKYGFREAKLERLAKEELMEDLPDFELVKTLILPLSSMLTLYIEKNSVYLAEENLHGKILSIIHTGYTRKLTVSEIAAACHYSTSFINRYFKEKSGETINEYLTKTRMKKARQLLLNSEISIEDIAASTGFSDTNYFISSFSKFYGLPPKKYKNANKT